MKIATKVGLSAMAAFLAFMVPVMSVAGWYPQRELRKWEGDNTPGFDHVTFNSFYNTPFYGNETEFFDGKQTGKGPFFDNVKVKVGDEITLRTYVHNGAGPNLNNPVVVDGPNGPQYTGPGVARNTTVKVGLPQGVGTRMNAVSQISATNAQPGSVFDTVDFTSENGTPFQLSYVPGSAYASTHSVAQMPLADSIVTTGALIGETQPDGNVPGCFAFADFVVIKVKVEAAPLQIKKQVAFPKQAYQEKVEAKAGDRLYFKIDFDNTGNIVQHNLALSDQLPSQLQLIPGTIKLCNGSHKCDDPDPTKNNPLILPDNTLFTQAGQSVGDYAAHINGYVTYQVTVKPDAQGTLNNIACVRSDEVPYNTCDNAQVVTPQPPPPPTCPAGYPVGDARCNPVPPPPTTPPTTDLPETGMESGLAGVLGMTGISASVHAYRKSKQAVGEALKAKANK